MARFENVVAELAAALIPDHRSNACDETSEERHQFIRVYSQRRAREAEDNATADKPNDYENQHCAAGPSLLARCGERIRLPLFEHRTLPREALFHQVAQIILCVWLRQNLLIQFQLGDKALDFLHANRPAHDQAEIGLLGE